MRTKGKWTFIEDDFTIRTDDFNSNAGVGDYRGIVICEFDAENWRKIRPDSIETKKANAEHIVHCVNTHDELVEACEGLIKAIQYARKISLRDEPARGSIWGETRSLLDVARHKAEQAILKAKGGV